MDYLISELGGSASTLGREAVNQVRNNIFPRVGKELRENIVPKLEQKGKELKERWNEEHHPQRAGVKRRRRRPRPPSNTDMVYLTDRFLVSSKPAPDNSKSTGPTFFDTGRDLSSKEAREAAERADQRQQELRHDRAYRQRRKLSQLSRSITNDSIQENIDSLDEEEPEPSASSIPEEEDDDPAIERDSNADFIGNKEQAAELSENPQDCSAGSSLRMEGLPSALVVEHVEATIGEGGDEKVHGQEQNTQSPAANVSLSPSLTNTNHTPDVQASLHASFCSNATDLIVNHDSSVEFNCSNHEEDMTPLTKNLPARVMTGIDGEILPNDNRLPSIPSMPQPQLSTNVTENTSTSDYKQEPITDDADTSSIASFATCKEDDDTVAATPELSQRSRSEPAIENPPNLSISSSTTPAASPTPTSASIMNSPGSMVTFLDKEHGRDKFLAVSLAKEKPDDRTLLLFRRQIVPMGLAGNNASSQWSPCCAQRSETPSIPHMLKICYALHAFLHLDPNNVVLTYCDNGKTRTAIVAACYLKFSNMIEKTEDGFRFFLLTLRRQRKLLLDREKQQRKEMGSFMSTAIDTMFEDYYDDVEIEHQNYDILVGEEKKKNNSFVENIFKRIPPSLKLFFEQFDRVLKLGGFLNRKPLLLRAIMLQGVPVEDQPCLDIWDSSQRHVYTSHPPTMTNNSRHNKKPVSQWVDEEGFYRINTILDGEFLVLCRFGGDPAQLSKERNIHDPSRILFRYTNTTGFMSGGCPYELPAKDVDLMRLYADHLDDEEFLLTLMFEADWEHIENDEKNVDTSVPTASKKRLQSTSKACGERIWRSHEEEARDEGWRVIFENHCARPSIADIESFRRVHRNPSTLDRPDMSNCPDHLVSISLQLANYDFKRAAALLLYSPTFSWWLEDEVISSSPPETTSNEILMNVDSETREHSLIIETDLSGQHTRKSYREVEEEATRSILNILDSVDVTPNLDLHDQSHIKQWKSNNPHEPPSSGGAHRQDNSNLSTVDHHSSNGCRNSLSGLCLRETGYLIPSIIYPHRGDIVRSFHIHGTASSPEGWNDKDPASSLLGKRKISVSNPRIPYFSDDKPKLLPPPSDHIRVAKCQFDNPKHKHHVPVYDTQLQNTKEILSQLRHTGVTLDMLVDLRNESKQWTGISSSFEKSIDSDVAIIPAVEEIPNGGERIESSMNREEKGKKEKGWQDAQRVQADEKRKSRDQEKANERIEVENLLKRSAKNESEAETKVLLKDDPEYGKYFKMLKLGMPREQVQHAFQRDGKDPKILDLDPDKSLESQMPSASDDNMEEDVPLKCDPEYEKYFKMLKLGMPKEQVLHALKRDGKDPKILDLDPDKSLESQLPSANADDEKEYPLEDDPEYAKYFKMLKLGMPKEQVIHALKRDEKDTNILDLDPKKSLKSQVEKSKQSGDGVPLKDDPEYSKYFKMIKMGMPKEQVLHSMKRDGKDPNVLNLDPDRSLQSQAQKDDGLPLKDDPEYGKYFKMEKVGLPKDAIRNALIRDGKDPKIIDLDPNISLKAQTGGLAEEKDTGIPMKDDPDYAKYLKMEKMGMPKDVVRNALVRDGKNPAIIDFNPTMSVGFQLKKLESSNSLDKPSVKKKKKKKIRRKKIYWNPIDPKKLKQDSLWNIVKDRVAMGSLKYDLKEFEELFTESTEAGAQQKKKGPVKKEAKKAVQVIDPKRSMNGGIVLSTIKTDRKEVAKFVDKMDHTKFNATELKNLKDYLASAEERMALDAYMSKGAQSEEKKEELFNDLSETEKYMVTLMNVSDAEAKLHTMEFRNSFKNRFADMTSAVRTLNYACDELRSSERFQKLMAMILTVVNHINTGGEGNLAMGFTLDALLKLNEAKAFDKKTSVLHYVVKLVKKNDESLLYFEEDLGHVIPAESILLDGVIGDVKVLQNELEEVIKIVTKDADALEELGDIPEPTLAELVEQKSFVQHIGEVPPKHNTTSQSTGRTPMERFSMNAKIACEQALESINSVEMKYSSVLHYFGEDEKMPTGDFFGILRRFMTEWKKATKQVEKIERRKAKEKKRELRRAAKANKKAKPPKSHSRKNGDSKNITGDIQTITPGDVAALATEASLTTSRKKEVVEEDRHQQPAREIALEKSQDDHHLSAEGIVTQAALANSLKQEAEDAQKESQSGGIAALAAQAALAKSLKQEAEDAKVESQSGGVAAPAEPLKQQAAQAALENSSLPKQSTSIAFATTLSAETSLQESKDKAGKPQETDVEAIAPRVGQPMLEREVTTTDAPKQQGTQEFSSKHVVESATPANQILIEKAENDDAEDSLLETTVSGTSSHIAQVASETTTKLAQQDGVPLSSSTIGGSSLASQVTYERTQTQSPPDIISEDLPKLKMSSLVAQVVEDKATEQSPQDVKMKDSSRKLSSLATQVALEKSPRQSPKIISSLATQAALEKSPSQSPKIISSLATQAALEKSPNQSSKTISSLATQAALEKSLRQSPKIISSLATQVALEKSPNQSPKIVSSLATQAALEKSPNQSSKTTSSLATQAILEETPKQSPKIVSSLATQVALEKSPNQSSKTTSSLATQAALEKSPNQSSKIISSLATQAALEKSPNQSSKTTSSLATQVALEQSPNKSPEATLITTHASVEKTKRQSPQMKMPELSPIAIRSSLATAFGKVNSPLAQKNSTKRSPTGLMSSLALALDKGKRPDQSNHKSPSLRSFFANQSRQDERSEILRQNYDDSSVAQMAKNLQKEPIHDNNWNQGGGIADYIGWANQAIKASDTDSVRDFETARDIDDQSTIATGMDDSTYATNFDDGTIATNFDDDASIATEMNPRDDPEYIEGGNDYYSEEHYSNYAGGTDDPYSYTNTTDRTHDTYGGAVNDMSLEFHQDQGLEIGFSFGEDGFDGPGEYGTNEMMHGSGYGGGLEGFGQDDGLGGFGLSSPTITLGQGLKNSLAKTSLPGPPLGGGNNDHNLPWGATPNKQSTRKDEERNRPDSEKPSEEGVVFRGWGDKPKTPEQPKRKNWFWG